MKNWDFVIKVILEIKITGFTYLLSDEGCNSFPKHLDLALAPKKTNEGNETPGNMINRSIVLLV